MVNQLSISVVRSRNISNISVAHIRRSSALRNGTSRTRSSELCYTETSSGHGDVVATQRFLPSVTFVICNLLSSSSCYIFIIEPLWILHVWEGHSMLSTHAVSQRQNWRTWSCFRFAEIVVFFCSSMLRWGPGHSFTMRTSCLNRRRSCVIFLQGGWCGAHVCETM